MSDTESRAEYLQIVSRSLIVEHDVWTHGAQVGMPEGGKLDRAVADFCEAFRYGDIPEGYRDIAKVAEDLERERDNYHRQAEILEHHGSEPPGEGFCKAIERLAKLYVEASEEPIDMLPAPRHYWETEGMKTMPNGLQAIANIYGWKDKFGRLDTARVQRELANPSKEFKDGVPNPAHVDRQRKKAAEEKRRAEALARHRSKLQAAASSKQVAPESIEELVLQGVGPAQICRMKQITMGELENTCRELGIPMPGEPTVTPDEVEAEVPAHNRFEVAGDLEVEDDGDNEGGSLPEGVDPTLSLEEQIIQAHDQNPEWTHSNLADLFDVTPQKVTAVLKRREEIVGGQPAS